MISANSQINILVIEDDTAISSAIKNVLEARNFSVKVINNGRTALNYLESLSKESYQLVLLDIMLPEVKGWEILIKIRSLPATSHYPVIMLTAIDDEISESRAIYDGADDYIKKPFSFKVLLARIEAILRKKTSSYLDFELPFTDGNFKEVTEREKEIIGYIVKGYNNREIADFLCISENTVGNHISNIFLKLGVKSRTQLAIVALKYSLYL
jgi:DNA-binding NarL/FixJ family response regulator